MPSTLLPPQFPRGSAQNRTCYTGLIPPNTDGGQRQGPKSQPARLQILANTGDLAKTLFPLVMDGKVLQEVKQS